jgi:hypothetical protein
VGEEGVVFRDQDEVEVELLQEDRRGRGDELDEADLHEDDGQREGDPGDRDGRARAVVRQVVPADRGTHGRG